MRFYFTVLMDILEYGLEGDTQKVHDYGEVWLNLVHEDKSLTEEQRTRYANAIERALARGGKNRKGNVIHLAGPEPEA